MLLPLGIFSPLAWFADLELALFYVLIPLALLVVHARDVTLDVVEGLEPYPFSEGFSFEREKKFARYQVDCISFFVL
jgi:hypothetical protein